MKHYTEIVRFIRARLGDSLDPGTRIDVEMEKETCSDFFLETPMKNASCHSLNGTGPGLTKDHFSAAWAPEQPSKDSV